jgi:TonB family protein
MKKIAFLILMSSLCALLFSQSDTVINSTDTAMVPDSSLERDPYPLNMDALRESIGYPKTARAEGASGVVWVRVLIDSTGKYVKHKLLQPAHPILDSAVTQHISMLRFSPPVDEYGKTIKFWVNIPFKFTLQGTRKKKRRRRRN